MNAPSDYARELLALGIPPRAVMHLVLQDLVATLGEWTADLLTCDELVLVQQAKVHLENAEHCMLMLLRPSEALCEPHIPLHLIETLPAPPDDHPPMVCDLPPGRPCGDEACERWRSVATCQAKKNAPASLGGAAGALAGTPDEVPATHTLAGWDPLGSP